MAKYVMALDQGTTSSRCVIFDVQGATCAMAQQELTQFFPAAGWVEHDPMEIWESQLAVAKAAMAELGLTVADIAAIGIANQRETVIVWDKRTGKPLMNAIVWQCRRTAADCDALRAQGLAEMIRAKTGLVVDAYFSATKVQWILDNVPNARADAAAGHLLFGTVDTWLLWRLTGGTVHATDYSNASRTMLFNIHTLTWDDELLRLFDIPRTMLPEVKMSSGVFGYTDVSLFGGVMPIGGAAGDQQAALFGQRCFAPGMVKNTYGTGCFILMNTGETAVDSQNGLLTTIAWGLSGQVSYALEGSVFVAGAAIQWLRDGLQIIDNAAQSGALAESVPDADDVYFVPAFVGLGAPYWDSAARGAITGLTRGTTRAHIVRAALESMAYQSYDMMQAMEADTGLALAGIAADGGASANSFLMQFQADILGVAVSRPRVIESTALGAAMLAGLAVDFWRMADFEAATQAERLFTPQMDESRRTALLQGWHKAIGAARWRG